MNYDRRKKMQRSEMNEETQLFTFQMRLSQYNTLRQMAEAQNVTMSYLVDSILESAFKKMNMS